MRRATWPLTVIFLSCLVLALLPQTYAFDHGMQARQILGPVPSSSTPITPTPTPTPTPSSTTPSSSSTPVPTSTTSSTTPSTTPSSTQTTSSTTPTSTLPSTTAPAVTPSSSPTSSSSIDTSAHQVTTVVTATPTDTATPSPSVPPSPGSSSGSSSLGSGTIIGLSVAGGVAVIGIVAFLIWKFTRKRFSDFDDNEAIKWPELNAHGGGDSHPLPVHNTGRAGFGDTDSLRDASRAPSVTGYDDSMATSSTELHPGMGDPYAVPPLPHLNPSQPYRDDPQFYDPYRGPVPNTFDNGEMVDGSHAPGWSGEAIPMTQMSPGGRARSPGPQMAFDGPARTMSPQQMGRRSPGPAAALAYGEPPPPSFSGGPMMDGRARSPGPAAGLGAADRRSPGPQSAYGAR